MSFSTSIYTLVISENEKIHLVWEKFKNNKYQTTRDRIVKVEDACIAVHNWIAIVDDTWDEVDKVRREIFDRYTKHLADTLRRHEASLFEAFRSYRGAVEEALMYSDSPKARHLLYGL